MRSMPVNREVNKSTPIPVYQGMTTHQRQRDALKISTEVAQLGLAHTLRTHQRQRDALKISTRREPPWVRIFPTHQRQRDALKIMTSST